MTDAPNATITGSEVSISNATPPAPGERHSRLWIQFLTGAIALIEDEVARGLGDLDEKRRQIAEKQREIAIHTAMHPDASRDAEYMRAHLEGPG